jgi:hypothetical protein
MLTVVMIRVAFLIDKQSVAFQIDMLSVSFLMLCCVWRFFIAFLNITAKYFDTVVNYNRKLFVASDQGQRIVKYDIIV